MQSEGLGILRLQFVTWCWWCWSWCSCGVLV